MSETRTHIRRALLSVSDKAGLVDFARQLTARGVALIASGGTRKALQAAGIASTEVSEVTGFPEIMDGRVKTLHPNIHGGLLGRRDVDQAVMAQHGIDGIDLLVVNLYPFAATVAAGADFDACIENIDIGGPALIRAAAKNHAFVTVVTDPADYPDLLSAIDAGGVTAATRRRLAAAAFAHTAAYDAAIAHWFEAQQGEPFPARLIVAFDRAEVLRYGENPHQRAAFYRTATPGPGVATARQTQGKALSYNNLNDTDAAWLLVSEFDRPAVAIIKHANPCGVAEGATLAEAYARAKLTDPDSAFGGIVAVNRTLDAEAAEAIGALFAEVVIAPAIAPQAAAILAKKRNLRVLDAGAPGNPNTPGLTLRSLAGGVLVQDTDTARIDDPAALRVVTRRQPTAAELADLLFAWRVAKHVKSNAIVYARELATVGIGAGQMSRVDSARIAADKARREAARNGWPAPATIGSAVASDAFFPFADGLLAAAEAGATSVIQPGGSIRDDEVIAAADAAGLAMVFTGIRHFRH